MSNAERHSHPSIIPASGCHGMANSAAVTASTSVLKAVSQSRGGGPQPRWVLPVNNWFSISFVSISIIIFVPTNTKPQKKDKLDEIRLLVFQSAAKQL